MSLVKKDEFEVLKKMVQRLIDDNEKLKKNQKKTKITRKKSTKKKKGKKEVKKR